jgi:hypothetical protein
MKKKKFKMFKEYGREFLNPNIKKLTAWVMWECKIRECLNDFDCDTCSDQSDCNRRYMLDLDANLRIKDCSDTVKLDFDLRDSSELDKFIKNNIGKIDTLIKEATIFREEYIKCTEIMKSNLEKIENKDNKKGRKKSK